MQGDNHGHSSCRERSPEDQLFTPPHVLPTASCGTSRAPSSSRASSSRASLSSEHEHDEEDCLSLYRQQSRTIQRMASMMTEMKKKQDEILSLVQSPRSSQKRNLDIPNYVRIAVRDGYKSGTDEEHGLSWTYSRTNSERKLKWNSSCNEQLSHHIETFVMGIYPNVDVGIIRAAIERYYRSTKENDQRRASGKTELHKKRMAGLERKRRKMMRRQQALKKKTSYTDDERTKVKNILTLDFMSSEEEVVSEEEEFFVVKKLPWRSPDADTYIRDLDSKAAQQQNNPCQKAEN